MSLSEVDSEWLVGGSLLDLTHTAEAGELLVSRANGQIQVINMVSGVCVRSWQLTSAQRLSCPAVQHPSTRVFWAISTNTDLLTWQETDSSIGPCTQRFNIAVYCLLVAPSNTAPLVVLSNGTVCGADESPSIKKNKSIKVEFANVMGSGGRVCVVCSCEGVKQVTVWEVSSEGVTDGPTITLDHELSSYCVCADNLLATDSSGTLHCWTIDTQIVLLRSVPVGVKVQLAVLTNYFITFSGNLLLLWEPTYMTKQVEVKVHSVSKVFSCDKWICGVGEGMKLWRVNDVCSGLVEALGKTCSQWPMSVSSWEGQSCEDESVLARLTDKSATPSLKSFMTEFSSCPVTSDLCYSPVLERVLEEDLFWAGQAIHRLVKSGLVSSDLSDRVLLAAWAHKDWDLMTLCLEQLSGFTEPVLVDLLEQVIKSTSGQDGPNPKCQQRLLVSGLLLCQPFNDVLLQQPLSQLSPAIVHKLLQFLSTQLSVCAFIAMATHSYNSLLDWTNQIIDVHFTQLTFDPKCREILIVLQRGVCDQMRVWGRLCEVRGAVGAWNCLSHTPKTNGWLYKVETMNFDL